MYYGDKRDSKVNICHTLQDMGWTIFGYSPDQSDSMTDYYCPAHWDGIATKNGYVLAIDVYDTRNSGKDIFKYVRPDVTFKSRAKIEQLQRLANDSAATAGEKVAALAAIDRLNQSAKDAEEKAEAEKSLLFTWPVYQVNPPHCNWHIEKDGVIVAKGRGAFQFHNLPYWVDHMTGKEREGWSSRWDSELREEQMKDLKKFQSFINKVENVVSLKIGNSDGETEYKIVTETQYKTEYKAVAIKLDNLSAELEPGVLFRLDGHFNYGCNKGSIYKVIDDRNGIIRSAKMNGKLDKHLTGSARGNSFSCRYDKFAQWVSEGAISIVEIQQVKTPYEVEKCVKVKKDAPKRNAEPASKKESANAAEPTGVTYSIVEDTDTRDNSQVWVVKINERLEREQYKEVAAYMRTLGGYYSKFKHGFLFREDPTEKLNGGGEKPPSPIKNGTDDKQKTLDKITKQLDGLQKKIDGLSGDYKTNTWKRMREQESRYSKIEGYKLDQDILQYLASKLGYGEELTTLENALLVQAFRDDIHSYYGRHCLYNSDKRPSAAMPIKYPEIDTEYPDSWYNKEVPAKQKRLNKGGIYNTDQLIKAVEEYAGIMQVANKPIDGTERKIRQMEAECKMMQKGDINFTPANVAAQLVELARISASDRVLEPSAGTGAIADEIRKITQNIDVVERMATFRELLQLKGYNLVGDDFLQYETEQPYDAIIMNPPFSDEANHIKHAYSMLKDGGTLVSITSPHWEFAGDSKARSFREWVEELDGYTQELPSGTFEMTGVASRILVIEKRAEQAA